MKHTAYRRTHAIARTGHAVRSRGRHFLAKLSHKARIRKLLAKRHGKLALACSRHSAYPSDFFMWSAPAFVVPPVTPQMSDAIATAFDNGYAGKYSPQQLVEAGIFSYDPLRGGIFVRREDIKYIILHSTETMRPADAQRVIHSWNRGMRHPGAQFVVDRDGSIYETVDPEFGTVHVDIHRTLNGVNNDNAIGIEIVRSGDQQYTKPQLDSVTRLVSYLQSRYSVRDDDIFGHGQIQPSDRRDPVDFDWTAFHSAKASLKMQSAMLTKKKAHTRSFIIPASKRTIDEGISEAECGSDECAATVVQGEFK